MRRKNKKSVFRLINLHKFRQKHRFFAFFIFIFVLMFLYFKFLLMPLVVENTRSQMKSFATKAITFAVADSMNQNLSYGELIKIEKDSNNDISLIEVNSVRINVLSKTMSRVVMSNFLEFSEIPITISLGAFSGIAVLSEVGPKIAFNVNPYSEVHCYFKSSFESAGINQTYHKLYMIIEINVNIVLPFRQISEKSEAEVLISESLIIGKIPEVYLNSGKLDEMLNLIPNSISSWQNR